MNDDPIAYLDALEDARRERDELHPHRPLLRLVDTTTSLDGNESDPDQTGDAAHPPAIRQARRTTPELSLDEQTRELGRRRVAEMRAIIERNREKRDES